MSTQRMPMPQRRRRPLASVVLPLALAAAAAASQAAAAPINVALNAPVVSYTGPQTGGTNNTPSALTNGLRDDALYHQVYPLPAEWVFDLGASYTVDRVYIDGLGETDFYLWTDYQVFGSNQSASGAWTELVHVTNNTLIDRADSFAPFTGRWFRVRVNGSNWGDPAWQEFELYGVAVPEPRSLALGGLVTLALLGARGLRNRR